MKAQEQYGVGGYRCKLFFNTLLSLTFSHLDIGNGAYEASPGHQTGRYVAPPTYGAVN